MHLTMITKDNTRKIAVISVSNSSADCLHQHFGETTCMLVKTFRKAKCQNHENKEVKYVVAEIVSILK